MIDFSDENELATPNAFASLSSLSDDELLDALLTLVGHQARGSHPKREAQALFSRLQNSLQQKICESSKIQRLSLETKDSHLLYAALIDVVSGALTGVAAAAFVVLLMRDGVPTYCQKYWKPSA